MCFTFKLTFCIFALQKHNYMIQRIYIDTSVIGGCLDEEFSEWSNQLFEEIKSGFKVALISDITYREIELAPKDVKEILFAIPSDSIEVLLTNTEVETLADNYIRSEAVSKKFYEDALHIANATVHSADILVSWNFKHIVNLERIRKYNAVNMMLGYRSLEIRTPREILKENEDDK